MTPHQQKPAVTNPTIEDKGKENQFEVYLALIVNSAFEAGLLEREKRFNPAVISEALKITLSSTYKQGYLKALEDVKQEMPEKYVHKNNPHHVKDEYWGCCDCYDDGQKNVNRSATLSAISRLEKQQK